MAYLGWLFVGLLLGSGITYLIFSKGRYFGFLVSSVGGNSRVSVASLLHEHFHPVQVADITISERSFPFRMRADLQRTIDKYFGDGITVRHFFVTAQ